MVADSFPQASLEKSPPGASSNITASASWLWSSIAMTCAMLGCAGMLRGNDRMKSNRPNL